MNKDFLDQIKYQAIELKNDIFNMPKIIHIMLLSLTLLLAIEVIDSKIVTGHLAGSIKVMSEDTGLITTGSVMFDKVYYEGDRINIKGLKPEHTIIGDVINCSQILHLIPGSVTSQCDIKK